jgi:hypothetical protein
MANTTNERLAELRRCLGSVTSPNVITQGIFEDGPEHLERLAALRPGEQANLSDLSDYMYDLHYRTDIQIPLFLYLLPFCLEKWDEYIRNDNTECPGFAQHFCTVLGETSVLSECLSSDQCAAVLEFMRKSILKEIDAQDRLHFQGYPAPPYRWIRALNTYGVISSDIERIWTDWWSVGTQGQAIAAVQYVSCLMYEKDENPIFAPYTREEGGGPPCLWDFDGRSSKSCWQEPNILFLTDLLETPKNVIEVLIKAVERLAAHSERVTAQKVLSDVPQYVDRLTKRCRALPELLGSPARIWLKRWEGIVSTVSLPTKTEILRQSLRLRRPR